MAPPTGLGGWTGNNAIESHEKLGSGQFVNNNFLFFQFSQLLSSMKFELFILKHPFSGKSR